MTLEKAIGVLESISAKTDYILITDDARSEALDMAISALQAQDVPDTNVEGMISKQKAIDALKGLPTWWADEGGFYSGAQPPMTALLDHEDAVSAIANLPSAQPESNWIPVSERMPEDGENCLVSVRCSNNFLVDRGTYSTDLFKVDEEHFFGKRGESGWYYINSEYGYCRILNVIAWMPLPEPYKKSRN